MDVLADVYAEQSAPSCSNTSVRDKKTGYHRDWCGFLPVEWEIQWCRKHVNPLTRAAWSGNRTSQWVDFFKQRCEWHVYCAVPSGTLDTPYCDLATAVANVPESGTIGLVSGQSFKAPITIAKPSTLIAIGGSVSVGQ